MQPGSERVAAARAAGKVRCRNIVVFMGSLQVELLWEKVLRGYTTFDAHAASGTTAKSEAAAMKSQRAMPRASGRQPTSARALRERPAPIRKRARAMPDLAAKVSAGVTGSS